MSVRRSSTTPRAAETLKPCPEFVEVGPGGTIVTWTWIAEPTRKHPFAEPFAFASIRPDGADAAICHVVGVGPEVLAAGGRVRTQYREERRGVITDLYFAPEAEAENRYVPPGKGVVERTEHLISLELGEPLSPAARAVSRAAGRREVHRARSPTSGKVYLPSKGYDPIERVRMSERDDVVVSDRGTVVAKHRDHAGAELRPEGDRALHPGIDPALDGADQPLGEQDIRSVPDRRSSAPGCGCARCEAEGRAHGRRRGQPLGRHGRGDRTLGADRRADVPFEKIMEHNS